MQTKNSTSPALVVIILLLTFPIWIGLIGGFFGIVGGLIGAIFGVIGSIFGAIFHAFGSMLHWMFNWPSWGCSYGWSNEVWTVLLVVAVIWFASKSRKK